MDLIVAPVHNKPVVIHTISSTRMKLFFIFNIDGGANLFDFLMIQV
jgi:hypothetical protein